jgi:hypothetical protein
MKIAQSFGDKSILELMITAGNKAKRAGPFLLLPFILWKLNIDFLFLKTTPFG